MAKKTLSCTLPDGTKATRKTDHEYKYVVIGRVDVEKIRAGRAHMARAKAANDFNFLKKVATGLVKYKLTTAEEAIAELGSVDATRESYEAKVLARYRKNDVEKWGRAEKGPWEAIAWSTKDHLAQARLAKERNCGYRTDLQIVPVSE